MRLLDDFHLFGDDRIPQNLSCDIVIIRTSYDDLSLMAFLTDCPLTLESVAARRAGMEVDDVLWRRAAAAESFRTDGALVSAWTPDHSDTWRTNPSSDHALHRPGRRAP